MSSVLGGFAALAAVIAVGWIIGSIPGSSAPRPPGCCPVSAEHGLGQSKGNIIADYKDGTATSSS